MQKEIIQREVDTYIVGLSVRTSNQESFDSKTNKIAPLITRYWQENIANTILHRKNPGVTIAVYADYESDEHGHYTYFFGEEVSSLDQSSSGLTTCIIPAGKFARFTTIKEKMPDVVIEAWMNIWKMTPHELGGRRCYYADFEVYDERA